MADSSKSRVSRLPSRAGSRARSASGRPQHPPVVPDPFDLPATAAASHAFVAKRGSPSVPILEKGLNAARVAGAAPGKESAVGLATEMSQAAELGAVPSGRPHEIPTGVSTMQVGGGPVVLDQVAMAQRLEELESSVLEVRDTLWVPAGTVSLLPRGSSIHDALGALSMETGRIQDQLDSLNLLMRAVVGRLEIAVQAVLHRPL